MSELENFEILEDHAVFRPPGQVSAEIGAKLVATAIAFARERNIRKLLVDASGWAGSKQPSRAKRYFYINDWARAAGGLVRVAFVTRPEFIDPRKFGRIVASNADFIAEVFTTDDEALTWLRRLK